MSSKDFYNTKQYRKKQSRITKQNWKEGKFDFMKKRETRTCLRPGCDKSFSVKLSNPKKYCTSNCAAVVNNKKRKHSVATKNKIAKSLSGKTYPERQGKTMKTCMCSNPDCKKDFTVEAWRNQRYCSNLCAMQIVGGKPTSPKAARGKAGIRPDIDSTTYFYSRWEANYARILELSEVKWVHQPKVFELKEQNYTPDFYLPYEDIYVEIKNFLSDYSRKRDEQFRDLYPNLTLLLILKKDYLKLQKEYALLIEEWEFS